METQDKMENEQQVRPIPLRVRLVVFMLILIVIVGLLIFAPSNWEVWRIYAVGIILAVLGGASFSFLVGGLTVSLTHNFGKILNIAVSGTSALETK